MKERLMEIKYWHELTRDQKTKILDSKIKVSEFMGKYTQPPWCGYPEALALSLGCWSLGDADRDINEDYCETCDQHIHNKTDS